MSRRPSGAARPLRRIWIAVGCTLAGTPALRAGVAAQPAPAAPRRASIGMALSPDGTRVACGGDGGSIELWDIATRAVRGRFTCPDAFINALAFAPDGRSLVTVGERIRTWDVSRELVTQKRVLGEGTEVLL